MKLALMIIDMQKAYYTGSAIAQMDAAAEYINYVIPYFEAKGLPIIWVYNVDKDDGAEPGLSGFEFIDSLKPKSESIIIHKTYSNSFNKTNCAEAIAQHNVDGILMTGFCAEECVLSTYKGARDLDLFPILLKNGIASRKNENKEFVENISETVTCGVLTKMLD